MNNPTNISEVKESYLRLPAIIIILPFAYFAIIIEYFAREAVKMLIPNGLKEQLIEFNHSISYAWKGKNNG